MSYAERLCGLGLVFAWSVPYASRRGVWSSGSSPFRMSLFESELSRGRCCCCADNLDTYPSCLCVILCYRRLPSCYTPSCYQKLTTASCTATRAVCSGAPPLPSMHHAYLDFSTNSHHSLVLPERERISAADLRCWTAVDNVGFHRRW